MKKLLFLLLLLPLLCGAQTNLDSLSSVWNDPTQDDTSRLKAMKKISWNGYLFTQPDSAFYFAQLQYDLADKKNKKKHMATALNTQGASFYLQADYAKAIEYFTKSLKIQEEIGDKKGVASSYNNIGIIYKNQGDYANSIDFYTKSLNIYEEIGNKKNVIFSDSLSSINLLTNSKLNI